VCVSRLISAEGLKIGLIQLVGLIVGTCSVLSIISLAGALYWVFDLSSHFRLQYFVTILALLPVLVLSKRKRLALLAGMALSINACEIAPYYWPRPSNHELVGARKLKILTINVNYENDRFEKILECIKKFDPDLVAIEELTPALDEELKAKLVDYKYSCSAPKNNPWGIGLFSRVPIEHSQVVYFFPDKPNIVDELNWEGKPLCIVATHPIPPMSPALADQNKKQLIAISEEINRKNETAVLVGDLNATSWCSAYKDAIDLGHLVDSSRGFGLQASWLRSFPPLCLPIDHCLTTPDMVATTRVIGQDIGSDHWPVYVELQRQRPYQGINLTAMSGRSN
jgi:endonuclease/exonuclease/phosphatase (EEP) superfamily protein YafD